MTCDIIPAPDSALVTLDSFFGPLTLDVTSLRGRWVAIRSGRVVGRSWDLETLMDRWEGKGGFVEYHFVREDVTSFRNRKCLRVM